MLRPWVELVYLDDGADSVVQTCEISWDDREKLLDRRDLSKSFSSRLMLKSFARTWLAGVRTWLEPLGDMSEVDTRAEGIEWVEPGDGRGFWHFQSQFWGNTPQEVYRDLWNSINPDRPWDPDLVVQAIEWR